jgi:hypothetical protein
MRFIRNGPDIPDRLLQAHEDRKVVFFCGAGISYPAALPTFGGLVARIFDDLGETPTPLQQAAIDARQYDTSIGLLEQSIKGRREQVRRSIAKVLTPDLTNSSATSTHEAILDLGRNQLGQTRIVTTNFDRIFEEVIARDKLKVPTFAAPLLPIPKNRWNGLVYLHGLLPKEISASELDRLVVSSGDFGLAYLSERWAARFVSEMFRNYIVCFVGYSINDPVLRYMMDALAADRLLGESSPDMFAFGSFQKGKEEARRLEWEAKNVVPILYRERDNHSYLHKTLRAWADAYRDGIGAKERIAASSGLSRPLAGGGQDELVGQLRWALSDERGLPAKRFADTVPSPSLDWLGPLTEDCYGRADLSRFGVFPGRASDNDLRFSILNRPSPFELAPRMSLTGNGAATGEWDKIMPHLARWLSRHLDNPRLILWIAKSGGYLHPGFAWWIQHQIDEITQLEQSNSVEKLEQLRSASPDAIPRAILRPLWKVVLAGRLKSFANQGDLFDWIRRIKLEGADWRAKSELSQIFGPRVIVREKFDYFEEPSESEGEAKQLNDVIDWEITLSANHVHSHIRELHKDVNWQRSIRILFPVVSG